MNEPTMRVSELMQTKVLTVRPSMSLVELHRFLLSHHIGGAPVVDGGRLVGIVTRSDIIRQMAVDRSIAEQIADYERDPGTGRLPGNGETDENEWINETASELLNRMTVGDVMTHELITVGPDADLQAVADLMVHNRIHRMIVKEGERLAGILTAFDLVRLFADGRAGACRSSPTD